MKNRITSFIAASTACFAFSTFSATTAHAGLADCGNIDVSAKADCEVRVEGGCTASCTPLSVVATCSADLYVGCQGTCNIDAEASCTASCDVGACELDCMGKGPSFDCKVDCVAKAEAKCDASCAAKPDQAKCKASCSATASGECEASCVVVKPEASCKAKCEASCQGECKARANVDCQVNCQSSGYLDCTGEFTGKCTAQCKEPAGAVFCNNTYVDAGGNLDKCISALNAALTVNVDTSARGSAQCMNNMCNAEGEAEASCAAAPGRAEGVSAGILGVLGLAIGGSLVRRRRR